MKALVYTQPGHMELQERPMPELVDGEVVLAYVSGANQLDERKLAAAAGGLKCARVDADTDNFLTRVVYLSTAASLGHQMKIGGE